MATPQIQRSRCYRKRRPPWSLCVHCALDVLSAYRATLAAKTKRRLRSMLLDLFRLFFYLGARRMLNECSFVHLQKTNGPFDHGDFDQRTKNFHIPIMFLKCIKFEPFLWELCKYLKVECRRKNALMGHKLEHLDTPIRW